MWFYLCLLLFGGIIVYNYQSSLLFVINCYLAFKYHNFQYQTVTKDYTLLKICRRSANGNAFETLQEYHYDLRKGLIIIHLGVNDGTLVFVHFRYDQQEYILPFWYTTCDLTLPAYSPEDVDTCMRVEYEDAKTETGKDVDLDLIAKYAGPKGNFYSDTKYHVKANMIYDEDGHQLVPNLDDHLQLITSLGESIVVS